MIGSRHGGPIVEGLTGATRALEAGDLAAAAEILAAVDAACTAAEASGQALAAADLEHARRLHSRLQTMVGSNQASLMASLLHSAKARAASHAYKPDP